ncbi:CRTAC1 family protein [Micromonospora sp. CB01531]|uniref:CRTAC1 family protein n=1 Tax=Micromonospora sp. CB01531 TaxID=1718947 RepID=UPI00093D9A60|nr:CRTAC1 family protein [Micromonospora sp. CB01531]OKI69699.1 RNA-binding protein [Micromonospora sp. CB01531]
MSMTVGWLRRHVAGVVALILVLSLFFASRLPSASATEREQLADGFAFTPTAIALPGGFPQQSIRKVNQRYRNIDAWISSVGSAIAMNDLDGDGLANDLCVTDPRTDQVTVTPTPGARSDRYAPFALRPEPLPMKKAMAPMGCVPGDFNEDGRMDLLVYFWGRTPILYLARSDARTLSMDAYQPTELVPGSTTEYTEPQWNTNAVAVDDFDGDGHVDIFVANYFPHGPVLDDTVFGGVEMNHSMSNGLNGGEDYFFRWTGATAGPRPTATFQKVDNVLPRDVSKGWALAAGANDVDGDLLPELYLAHDFGPDRFLHNRSVPGKIAFEVVQSARSSAVVPKSKRVGLDSFKGMGIDYGDLDGDGLYDMFVSNITTSFGIEESHFAFIGSAKDREDLRRQLTAGRAPFDDRSAPLGLAWSGWGWDVKMADFNNSGQLVVAQATGFVKGDVNRWPQLQELATANDDLLDNPLWWPHVKSGDDIGGSQRLHFFAKGRDGRYVDLAGELGLAIPVPTRGIATGDADGDGRLDFAVARQWDEPVFYHNDSPSVGAFLGLRLTHEPAAGAGQTSAGRPVTGSPAVGAQVTVTTSDGRTFITRVDGGSGHSGKRSNEAHIGLGKDASGPVSVQLNWRDRDGRSHEQKLQLSPGWHDIQLGSQAQER